MEPKPSHIQQNDNHSSQLPLVPLYWFRFAAHVRPRCKLCYLFNLAQRWRERLDCKLEYVPLINWDAETLLEAIKSQSNRRSEAIKKARFCAQRKTQWWISKKTKVGSGRVAARNITAIRPSKLRNWTCQNQPKESIALRGTTAVDLRRVRKCVIFGFFAVGIATKYAKTTVGRLSWRIKRFVGIFEKVEIIERKRFNWLKHNSCESKARSLRAN